MGDFLTFSGGVGAELNILVVDLPHSHVFIKTIIKLAGNLSAWLSAKIMLL